MLLACWSHVQVEFYNISGVIWSRIFDELNSFAIGEVSLKHTLFYLLKPKIEYESDINRITTFKLTDPRLPHFLEFLGHAQQSCILPSHG